MERHGRFGVANQVADIKGIPTVRLAPEGFFTDGFQNVLSVIDRERG